MVKHGQIAEGQGTVVRDPHSQIRPEFLCAVESDGGTVGQAEQSAAADIVGKNALITGQLQGIAGGGQIHTAVFAEVVSGSHTQQAVTADQPVTEEAAVIGGHLRLAAAGDRHRGAADAVQRIVNTAAQVAENQSGTGGIQMNRGTVCAEILRLRYGQFAVAVQVMFAGEAAVITAEGDGGLCADLTISAQGIHQGEIIRQQVQGTGDSHRRRAEGAVVTQGDGGVFADLRGACQTAVGG
ncbi:hypothetical protein FF38_06333 [Lucilia cuprina]|uniref:Uncharacterized protein n=1 Tax=Lucilia cuprina TaxID=7375 RepID=A0A0L0C0U8_LUCCU|nr:hypothetical protein FF38_06333 [Lucilia cuprina]